MILLLYCMESLYAYRNLDEISFIINIMAILSLRSRSHVKASMVLTRADHYVIHDYIRSLLNNILSPILSVRTGLEPASYCLCIRRLSQLSYDRVVVNIHKVESIVTSSSESSSFTVPSRCLSQAAGSMIVSHFM